MTKDQAATIADQFVAQAKSQRDQKELPRLEARAGSLPPGMTVQEFKLLVREAETHVYRGRAFLISVGLWICLIAVTALFSEKLIGAALILGMLLTRQLGRRLVANSIRARASGTR